MKRTTHRHLVIGHVLAGFAFGCIFPAMAVVIDVTSHGMTLSWPALLESHRSEPLLWIIDTAPFVLALVAVAVGYHHVRLVRHNAGLEAAVEATRSELAGVSTQLRHGSALLSAVLDAAVDGVFTIDAQGRITSANPAARAIFGYEEGDLLGHNVAMLMPEPERSQHQAHIDRYVATREAHVVGQGREVVAQRSDGTTFDAYLAVGQMVADDDLGFVGIVRDITAEKLLQKRVSDALSHLRAVLDASTEVAILATDLEGCITVFNTGAERMLGYRAEEVIGQARPVLFHTHDEILARANALSAELGRTVTEAEVFVHVPLHRDADIREWTYVRKDGTRLQVRVSITAIRNEAGETVGFLGVAADITAAKQHEADLVAARQQAEAADRAKSEFLASMSHEIRTPMNGVIGMTSVLLDTPLDSTQRELVNTVQRSAEALLTILNDILDFSKIEAGRVDLEAIAFDLREISEDVLGMFAGQASLKNLELTCLTDDDVPRYLHGDPGRLRQILINLVGNAVKFTEHGEVRIRLQLADVDEQRVRLRCCVEDTGVGIAAEAQRRLFQSFSQADASTTRKYGGTGLGLAISKRLVELMDGAIGVESTLGQGSTFWFEVDLGLAETPPATRAESLPPLQVLVVDDNATNRSILRHQLARRGADVHVAMSGLEGLEELRLAKRPFDLVVLDYRMPGLDGLSVARTIRQNDAWAGTRLLMLSSDDDVTPDELIAAGVDARLSKPVRESQLLRAIGELYGAEPPARLVDAKPELPLASPGARVLVAEDNPVSQQVAAKMLARLGYDFEIVADGLAAVELATAGGFDAILMDGNMPELDGYEATGRIRDLPGERGQVPIIALTADVLRADVERCLAAGMDAHLTKPVRVDELAAALATWVQRAPVEAAAVPELAAEGRFAPVEALGKDDPEFVATVLRTFRDGLDADLPGLRSAVAARNGAEVRRLAHRLKGSAAAIGAELLAERFQALEDGADAGLGAVAGLAQQLAGAEQEAREVTIEVERFLSS